MKKKSVSIFEIQQVSEHPKRLASEWPSIKSEILRDSKMTGDLRGDFRTERKYHGYTFECVDVCDFKDTEKKQHGNLYVVFSASSDNQAQQVVYVGQSADISARFPDHKQKGVSRILKFTIRSMETNTNDFVYLERAAKTLLEGYSAKGYACLNGTQPSAPSHTSNSTTNINPIQVERIVFAIHELLCLQLNNSDLPYDEEAILLSAAGPEEASKILRFAKLPFPIRKSYYQIFCIPLYRQMGGLPGSVRSLRGLVLIFAFLFIMTTLIYAQTIYLVAQYPL